MFQGSGIISQLYHINFFSGLLFYFQSLMIFAIIIVIDMNFDPRLFNLSRRGLSDFRSLHDAQQKTWKHCFYKKSNDG